MPRFRQMPEIIKLTSNKEDIRNIGIIAHIDHGKTTMTDSLLIGAGLLSPKVEGSARVLDYLEEEQKRGITIKTANISLTHKVRDRSYLVNLVDTPGHVDFNGKVTRALRAIDGAIVVVDAVEEIMAQTETVTREALEERVKPVLFINKIDRLVREMRLTAGEIQSKLTKIISDFNYLIETYAEPDFKEKWKVDPARESVVFGSALHRWGFTLKSATEKGMKPSNRSIVDAYKSGRHRTLSSSLPLHTAILDMVVNSLPSPAESQRYRIPRIWNGDIESEIGQAMLNCDDKGPTTMYVTNVQTTSDAGLMATVRLFSGSTKEGDYLYLVEEAKECRVQQVSMYMGAFREAVSSISAGNIAAISGLDSAKAEDTLVDFKHKNTMTPFEHPKHITEPVMTIVIEPKEAKDLPRIIEAMKRISTEDPNLVTTMDEETGQYVVSGIGELQLQVALSLLKQYIGEIDLAPSSPTTAYRETIVKQGKIAMAMSPNKQNKFWIQAEPVESRTNRLGENVRDIEERKEVNSAGKGAGGIWASDKDKNELVSTMKNFQNLSDEKSSIIKGFNWACKSGPLCEEPMREIKVKLVDLELSSDPHLRGSTQITRAVSRAILGSFLTGEPVLLEPVYNIEVTVPTQWFGSCTKVITRKRGRIRKTQQKGALTTITGYIPVDETLDLSQEMRSATSGYAFWQLAFDHWERTPENLSLRIVKQLRKKRGLPAEIPRPETFVDEI